jgi:hypothetical protein
MRKAAAFAGLASLLVLRAAAATFNVTPNVVSNDYSGQITIQMSGLSPGESVQVVQFLDFNGDGVVDGADVAIRGDLVTDGQVALLGGVRNINVLSDDDGATNGAISGSIHFPMAAELAGAVSCVFLFSSPSNHFLATSVPFTVVSAPYAQMVQGVVKSGGTNVPYVVVGLVQLSTTAGPPTPSIIETAADGAGHYTLKGPPGAYSVVASRPGYVMDYVTAPFVTLAANATMTTDLNLIAGTTTLSGSLADNDNPSLPALPYAPMLVYSTAKHQFTIATTDSNANFNVAVTPGVWKAGVAWQTAVTKGYLVPEPGSFTLPSFDTTTGPVAGATVPYRRATALIYGTIEDNHGNVIPGITLSANADGGAFDATATSGADGRYALAIDAGAGYLNVQDLTSPPADKYLWSGTYLSISDGQALNLNVTGIVATAYFRGQILDDSGAPVGQFLIFANHNGGGTSLTTTDTNGFFNLPVFGGTWQLYPDSGLARQRGLIFPPYSFQITDGIDLTNNIIARKVTGRISGDVHDQTNGAISGLYVTLSTRVDSTSYSLNTYTDLSGNYSFGVFNGTWSVSLSPYDLLNRGYNPANPVSMTLPPTNGTANIILIPIGPAIGPPRITITSLPDAFVGQAYSQQLFVTNAQQYFSWSISSGALPDGLSLDSYLGNVSGTPANTGLFNFIVQLTDNRGSNALSALSINVRSAPPQAPTLDMPALLPGKVFNVRVTGVAGQSYTLQFATTGTNWTDILTTNAPGDVFYLADTQATNISRWYRLRVNP